MAGEKTILVVEDEIDMLELIEYQLKAKGFKVMGAANGKEALERLKIAKPDLIILDINMPVMGGIEFYKKICDPQGQPQYPVFVLTARANMEQFFKDIAAAGFMSKPFEIAHLTQEIEAILCVGDRAASGSEGDGEEVPYERTWKRRICIVENDPEGFHRIAGAFLEAGYVVHSAKTGAVAMERIVTDRPDVALVKLDLIDMPGDVLVGKVQNKVKSSDMIFVLYRTAGADPGEIKRNSGDIGSRLILADGDEAEKLLTAVDSECKKAGK